MSMRRSKFGLGFGQIEICAPHESTRLINQFQSVANKS